MEKSKPEPKKKKQNHWREQSCHLFLEIDMKLIIEEFETLFKDYPLYSLKQLWDPGLWSIPACTNKLPAKSYPSEGGGFSI